MPFKIGDKVTRVKGLDIFWAAKCLRYDVSPSGSFTVEGPYSNTRWIYLKELKEREMHYQGDFVLTTDLKPFDPYDYL